MVQVAVNYFAIVVSALVNMALGFIWYGLLFRKMWLKEMGWTPEVVVGMKQKGMALSYGLMMLGSLAMAFILSHNTTFASSYLGTEGLNAGLQTGFWNWLGFIVPVTLGSVLWEKKSWKLWFLNVGYYLVSMLAMGAVLSMWM